MSSFLLLEDGSYLLLEDGGKLELESTTFDLDYKPEYKHSISFETQVNEKELGREQRYPVKIRPVRTWTLTLEKSSTGRTELESFFNDLAGSNGLFSFTWSTDKGGDGVTYPNCWLDMDTLKQDISYYGYGISELTFHCIDTNTPENITTLPEEHKTQQSYETIYKTIVDKIVTAASATNRRSLWSSPKHKWTLDFQLNKETRQELEDFFIKKMGRFNYFTWEWQTAKSGDGSTYNVRFDTDKIDFNITHQGYAKVSIPIKEVFPTSPAPADMKNKDEIIPRRLLEINLSSGPIRIIDNDTLASLTYSGNPYVGSPLKLGDYKRDDNTEVSKISVEISNAGQAISSAVGNNGDIVTGADCTLTLVWLNVSTFELLGTPAPRILFLGKANNLKFNLETASMDIESHLGGYEASIPFAHYMPTCQYRKFKDERCGYTGDQATCDRTLTTCKRYGNSENFGGFPSIPKEQVIRA